MKGISAISYFNFLGTNSITSQLDKFCMGYNMHTQWDVGGCGGKKKQFERL